MKTLLIVMMTMVFLFAGFTAVRGATGAEKMAVSAGMDWLSLIDSGKYTESWRDASVLFRGAVTAEQWRASLDGVRKPLGKPVKREMVNAEESTALPGAPDGRYVVMTMQSVFEHKQLATETVTVMLDNDGVWRAAGYFIK
ncbi:MAG: DUF4019 domain-containing protein [Chlorobiaceae bacterium]|nr:DUF4019 domain-containing protein [Chlorobiaceae bacterium]